MQLSNKKARELGIHVPPEDDIKRRAKNRTKAKLAVNQGRNKLFDAACKAHGLPIPVSEFRFWPGRKYAFDYLFDGWLALEIEGGAFVQGRHTSATGFRRDMEKYNEAAILGYAVLRCLPEQVEDGSVFATIKRALEAGGV